MIDELDRRNQFVFVFSRLLLLGMANGLSDLELATQQFQPDAAESDADEEVRSLDLPGNLYKQALDH